ncbi:putative retrotransposon gag domain-containing protein [Helianthus anomalus]
MMIMCLRASVPYLLLCYAVSDVYENVSKSSEKSRTEAPKEAAKTAFSFKQFKACGPKEFTGVDGPTAMFQWFDFVEVTLRQSGCPKNLRTLNATGVFQSRALDWWTAERNKCGNDAAYELNWEELKAIMMDEFCPPHERQKLEDEFWNIKQKDGDNAALSARFKQLSIICPGQVKTSDMAIKKYIRALPECVADFVHASNPATIEATYLLVAEINDKRVKVGFWDKASKSLHQATTAPTAETATAQPSKSSRRKKNNNNSSSNKNCAIATTAAPLQAVPAQQQSHQRPAPVTHAPPAKRAYTSPIRFARHAYIIIWWVFPVVYALTATCTATSLLTAVLVLVKPQFKPLLIKLCSQPRKANTRLRHLRSTPESATHVVIPTTLRTCARTGL